MTERRREIIRTFDLPVSQTVPDYFSAPFVSLVYFVVPSVA